MSLRAALSDLAGLIILCQFAFGTLTYSQNFKRELNSIPFFDENGVITNVFTGGINNYDFQFVDIDNDEDFDLFFLDSDGTYGWYENTGNKFEPAFIFSLDTIPGIKFSDWFYFVDIDNDSDFDYFTAANGPYIQYYKNTGSASSPSFILEEDTLKDDEEKLILSEFGSNPIFADVDSDEDYDFISGNSVGTLTFYENTGTAEAFDYKFITSEWQDILIISGGVISSPTNPSDTKRHGASSLDFADIDNDGDLDLFWGDFFSRSLYFIENLGSATAPDMEVKYSYYPRNEDSLITNGFNMPRLIDIDADADLDLFVTVLYDPTVPQSLIYFSNEGNVSNPDFIWQTDHFIRTLDAGIQSLPAFTDIDADGDFDFFIGSDKTPDGTLHFFENTGSASSPSFALVDSAYFGIKGDLSIAPAFGDLNGDGKPDLLIGNFNGTITYYRNRGNPQQPDLSFQGSLRNSSNDMIDIGTYARPFLTDVDSDGDLDLISGGFNGKFSFYRNTGDRYNYSFTNDTTFFSSLDIGDFSAPFLIDYDSDGDFDLFTGSRSGNILYFTNEGTNLNPDWVLLSENFTGKNFGGESTPVFIDIDSDSDMDLFVGNIKGGLYFLREQKVNGVEDKNIVKGFSLKQNYPNPFNPSTIIEYSLTYDSQVKLTLFNLLGEEILVLVDKVQAYGNYKLQFSGSSLPSGIYFYNLKASALNNSALYNETRKMIILH